MKSNTANSAAGIIILFFMMITCVKEKNEDNTQDEEESYIDAMYGRSPEEIRALAVADWKKFKKESENLLSITENNLKSLQVKIVDASENDKILLRSTYADCTYTFNTLKGNLEKKNSQFDRDLENFDESTVTKNEAFKDKFRSDMTALNIRLEEIIDQTPE